jgi:curved DNA-binding protein CbpA
MKSWYEVLEIRESATTEEIRSAYLKLVREYHPDRVPEDLTKLRADAEDKFKLIQQAWAALGDPAKRSQYDRIGRRPAEPWVSHVRRPDVANRSPQTNEAPAGKNIRNSLRSKQEFVKWSLLVLTRVSVTYLFHTNLGWMAKQTSLILARGE